MQVFEASFRFPFSAGKYGLFCVCHKVVTKFRWGNCGRAGDCARGRKGARAHPGDVLFVEIIKELSYSHISRLVMDDVVQKRRKTDLNVLKLA